LRGKLKRVKSKAQQDWDERITLNYRLWMSDGVGSDEEMFETGERDLNLLLEGLPLNQEASVLEIGCGVGRLLYAASKRFKRTVGVDISEVAISKAKELLKHLPNVELNHVTSSKLGVPDQSFDLVFSFATFPCLPTPEFCSYLLECARLLKFNGFLAIQIYLGEELLYPDDDSLSLRSYKPENLKAVFTVLGFENIKIKSFPPDYPVATSIPQHKTKAVIVVAQKVAPAKVSSVDQLVQILTTSQTKLSSQATQYELCLYYNYAKKLISEKNLSEALKFVEKALELSRKLKDTEIEVELAKLLSNLKGTTVFTFESSDLKFELIQGVACPFYKGLPLTNTLNPKAYEQKFAERVLEQVSADQSILLVGVGGGEWIECIAKKHQRFFVFEPIKEIAEAFLSRYPIFKNKFVERVPSNIEVSQVFMLPPYKQLNLREVEHLQKRLIAKKLKEQNLSIMVIGPISGGSLPIARYAHSAIKNLGYRSTLLDFSSLANASSQISELPIDECKAASCHKSLVDYCSSVIKIVAEEEKPQLAVFLAQAPVNPQTLAELSHAGITTVFWFVEDYLRFKYWQDYAEFYDHFAVIQKGSAILEISKVAKNVFYLPVAAHPQTHRPIQLNRDELEKYGSDLSFIGYGYPNRVKTFLRLLDYNFKVWGKMWPTTKPFNKLLPDKDRLLEPEEYIKIFCASKINLNLHSSTEKDFRELSGDFVNPRTFEIAACKAFQLVDSRSLLRELYSEDEIVTFDSFEDLKEKIDYFLARPFEREKFALQAYKRTLSDHTYEQRIDALLTEVCSASFQKISDSLNNSPWNRLLKSIQNYPAAKRLFSTAFQKGVPFDFHKICSSCLLGKTEYDLEEWKLLYLYHVNKNSKRFIKYA